MTLPPLVRWGLDASGQIALHDLTIGLAELTVHQVVADQANNRHPPALF